MRKKKKTYASVMKKTGNIRYSQKGRRAGKIALPPQVMRVGMQSLLAVLWEITMFFIFGDIFLTNRFGKPALIWVSVSAAALTVSFSYFKKADKWLLPMGELLVGLVLSWQELYPGLAGLIHLVVQKINMYYNVQIVSGFEQYLDLNPVIAVTAWLLIILSILQIYFLVVRKRLAGELIPPVLLIILDFAVGYAPSKRALICFSLAAAGSFGYRAAGRVELKQLEYLRQKAVCLFLVVAVVVSSLVFRVAEPKANEMVARRSEIEKAAQDMVTEVAMTATNLLTGIPFGKDIFNFHQPGRVSNMAPKFEDKPVMEVTAYQIPDDTVYLRGYVGDYYKNGSWKTYDSSDFVSAMQEVDSSLKEQTAGQQVQNILAYTQSYYTYYWDTIYRVKYFDEKDPYAYLPYYTLASYYQDERQPAEVLMDGDRTVLRNGNDVLEVDGTIRNSMSHIYMNALFTADLADGAYVDRNETLSESEVNEIIENMNSWRYDLAGFNSKLPEDEWAFIKKYNKYTEKYTYVPENLTRIRELGNQLEAEYERDYSDFVDNRFTENGTYYDNIYNFKEIYAVYLVKRELAKCNYNLDLDNVPWGQDVTEHFLFDTKEGFCQHFASAGTLLLRQMGIKARYVSGYAVSTSEFKKDSGGNYTAEVLDNQAHAWTEIYIDSVGWVPVEMTPGNKTGIDRLEIQQESDSITIRMNDGRTADLITLERSDYQDSSKDDSQSGLSGSGMQNTENQNTESQDTENQNTENQNTELQSTEMQNTEDSMQGSSKTENAGSQNLKSGHSKNIFILVVVIIILLLAAGIWYYLREIEGKRKKGTHSYKRIIRWNSGQIYRILRRKGIVNAKVQSDRTFREQLLNYEGWSTEEKERYLQILEVAAYSHKKLTREDVQFVQKLYRKLKE